MHTIPDYLNKIAESLVDFTFWTLSQAQRRKIDTLYFLARDGYVLKEIADLICQKNSFPISCKYLYCSRLSLRTPSYHLIGDEMFDLLFVGGYHVTLSSFFKRAGIEANLWEKILFEVDLPEGVDVNKEIPNAQIPHYREAFKKSPTYMAAVRERSKAEYETAIEYLKQEGLFQTQHVAIVDSGWTGSMQRSLRQLLESSGYKGKVTGFYFGLYKTPYDPRDGVYLSWYFSGSTGVVNKILFCNNLFECFLSAPHGMTLRYKKLTNGQYGPVLADQASDDQAKFAKQWTEALIESAAHCVEINDIFNGKKRAEKVFRSMMGIPSKQVAQKFGSFLFCDDVTENFHFPLASEQQMKLLRNYLILHRITGKFKKANSNEKMSELFWPSGTIAFLPGRLKRVWYRCNIFAWEWIKYTLK